MARSKVFKYYVNPNSGHCYGKPAKLSGVEFVPSNKDLVEITWDQLVRIEKGKESVADVIREGVTDRITKEVDAIVEPKTEKKVEKKVEKKAEKKADETDLEMLEALKSHKDVDQFAKDLGVDVPDDYGTIQEKKDYLKTVLGD